MIQNNIVESVCTFYMLLILVRWFAPFLELNMHDIRYRWIGRVVDPLVGAVRKILPNLGPMDFGPLATFCIVWIVREVLLKMLEGGAIRAVGG